MGPCQVCAEIVAHLHRGLCDGCLYLCDPERRERHRATVKARYHRLHPAAKYVPEKPKVPEVKCYRCKKYEAAQGDKLCLPCIAKELKPLRLQRFSADEQMRHEGEWWNRKLPEGCVPQVPPVTYEQSVAWSRPVATPR